MGLPRVTKWSRLARARAGYVTGCVGLSVGAAVQFGAGVGLMVGGALTAGSFLLLSDVDSEGETDE
ncbi:hypothetical protein KVH22_29995 [Streptomyces olivaceus]|uniref:hypothetical protein n=1 Tax=Streptomyces olivaceus TaxID=47716 RepID=UPI001CCB49E9|nr:hypothetical protein [Streptomyces olivaceus]MBZ6175588.1 hypothetical protein [Streptomyces olivaceus]MBZ6181870.1 hypothetical protein [Streptomyces olivaceus]MBZ6259752.1 hypothetical protein [Streptomyces olivaceus]